MLPVRDASAAWRTVLSVEIWMLNPFRLSEPAICTCTISWLPWAAKSVGGDDGQPVVDVSVRHTRPVRACALGIAAGRTGSIEMMSRGIISNSFGFFKLVLHRFSMGLFPVTQYKSFQLERQICSRETLRIDRGFQGSLQIYARSFEERGFGTHVWREATIVTSGLSEGWVVLVDRD